MIKMIRIVQKILSSRGQGFPGNDMSPQRWTRKGLSPNQQMKGGIKKDAGTNTISDETMCA